MRDRIAPPQKASRRVFRAASALLVVARSDTPWLRAAAPAVLAPPGSRESDRSADCAACPACEPANHLALGRYWDGFTAIARHLESSI